MLYGVPKKGKRILLSEYLNLTVQLPFGIAYEKNETENENIDYNIVKFESTPSGYKSGMFSPKDEDIILCRIYQPGNPLKPLRTVEERLRIRNGYILRSVVFKLLLQRQGAIIGNTTCERISKRCAGGKKHNKRNNEGQSSHGLDCIQGEWFRQQL